MTLNIGAHIPSFEGATGWVQTQVTESSLAGHLTIVHFWAVSCPICKVNFPELQRLMDTYARSGLTSVSIHMPRFEPDTDVSKVVNAVKEMGLTGPCAIDNQHSIGNLFGIKAWPSYFLFDRDCKLRSRANGNLGIKMAENSIARLINLEEA